MQHTDFSYAPAESRVPYWARATNPIVRRHLGLYWRTLPPQVTPIAKLALGWITIMFLSIILPFIFDMAMPLIVVSVLTMPVALLVYAHVLVNISYVSSMAMSEELRNNTMPLLMATPMTLQQIFLGKVAAAVWKRMEDLILVVYMVAVFAMPLLVVNVSQVMSPRDFPGLSHIFMAILLIVSLLRIVAETLMVGAIAVLCGIGVPYRSTAVTSAMVLSAFYFVFINLIRYIPAVSQNLLVYGLVELVLPLLLPILITWVSLRLSAFIINQD